jgi:hypothetical protein
MFPCRVEGYFVILTTDLTDYPTTHAILPFILQLICPKQDILLINDSQEADLLKLFLFHCQSPFTQFSEDIFLIWLLQGHNSHEESPHVTLEESGCPLPYIQESIHEQIRCAVRKWKTVTQCERKYTINET